MGERRTGVALAVALGVLGGSCTSDPRSGSTGATNAATTALTAGDHTAPSTVASPVASTTLAADVGDLPGGRMRAVLASDLGDRWRRANQSATITSIDKALGAECPSIARARDSSPPSTRARFEFRDAAAALPVITQDLTEFGSRDDAVAVFNAYVGKAIERCLPDLVTATGLPTTGVVIERRAAESAAEATAAIRLTGASFAGGVASEVAVEVIVAQHGRSVTIVVMTGSDLFPFLDAVRTAFLDALVR